MDEHNPLLSISSLSKIYGSSPALDSLDLDVLPREILTILGPSGSGKSTLLKILSGLEAQTEGSIRLEGTEISALEPENRSIGLIFQEGLLFPHMSVKENLCFPLRMQSRLSAKQLHAEVDWALELVRLTPPQKYYKRFPNQLSGGQAQRVALARGLIGRPRILLLDEPLANVDRQLRKSLEVEIRAFHQETGITFVYVTHNQEEALAIGDRLAVLNEGRIEQVGSPEYVYRQPLTSFVAGFVGSSSSILGELIVVSEDLASVKVGDQILTGHFPISVNPQALPSNCEVEIWLKNEYLHISLEELPQESLKGVSKPLPARVIDVLFKGSITEIIMELPGIGNMTSIQTGQSAPLEPGDRVYAWWNPKDAVCFPID